LQEFIDGVIPEANEDIYSTLGGLISRVHAIHDCPVMSDMNIPLIKDQLLSLGASYNMPKQFFKDVEGIPDFTKLPTSLVHTDLALRNTMIDKKGQFFLIDWDDAGQGITLLDTAYILVTLFDNKGSFNDMAATAFYEAYQKNRPFTDLEIALFFDAVLFWLLRYAVIDQVGMIESNWKKAIFWKKSGYQLLDKAQIIKSP
jgi:thiamine kinase-like enzyme